MLNIDMRL